MCVVIEIIPCGCEVGHANAEVGEGEGHIAAPGEELLVEGGEDCFAFSIGFVGTCASGVDFGGDFACDAAEGEDM